MNDVLDRAGRFVGGSDLFFRSAPNFLARFFSNLLVCSRGRLRLRKYIAVASWSIFSVVLVLGLMLVADVDGKEAFRQLNSAEFSLERSNDFLIILMVCETSPGC